MKVEKDRVVVFHYDMVDQTSGYMESTRTGDPVSVLHGHGSAVPGVEAGLAGREAGDNFEITVAPEQGYGERHPVAVERISKKYVIAPKRLVAGGGALVETTTGRQNVTVVKVGSKFIDVDTNHPMAGHTLSYSIEIVDVREADPEEIAHGHVHGPAGHDH